jgi:hypothetical protein
VLDESVPESGLKEEAIRPLTPGPSWEGYALRVDVQLRARFPNLVTRIFETSVNQYLIVFDRALQDAQAIAEEYENRIRFMTVGAHLSNEIPASFLREISPLTDIDAAGSMAGLPLRMIDLDALVLSRFPDLPIIGLREAPPTVYVMIEQQISDEALKKVTEFIQDIRLPLAVEFEVTSPPAPADVPSKRRSVFDQDNALVIGPSHRRPHAPDFVRVDEAFWFDHLNDAATGLLPPERFPGIKPDHHRCYIDLTVGEHVNLRQALLLYDEVFCSLPLAEGHGDFLTKQGLSEAELLQIVEAGRLTFVSTQPEERLNLPFLTAAAERHPHAILGRRTAALLLIADVALTADRYRLADAKFYPALRELAEVIAPHFGLSAAALLRALLWPLTARRQSLLGLIDRGTKSGPGLELAQVLAEVVKSATKVDIALEAMVVSERVHLGHALNATVFGALDEPAGMTPLMTTLGRELNFYRNFNTSIAAAWVGNERRRADGVQIVPPIPLLDFNPKIPMTEVLDDSALYSTRAKGRALFSRLAELPVEARDAEIDALVDRLRNVSRRRENTVLSFDNADTAIALGSIFASFVYPPMMGLAHLGRPLVERLRRIPAVDRMIQTVAEDTAATFGTNQDLDFLSRINRVAQLKRARV